MARTLPLQALHLTAGARLEDADGVLVPADHGDAAAEYAALSTGTALVELSDRGKLRVAGRDRVAFLHNMLTNDVRALVAGRGCHALKLTLQGKMEAALVVLADADVLWCDVDAGAAPVVLASLRRHRVMEDADIEDATAAWGHFAVQGPGSAAALAALGADVESLAAPLQHRPWSAVGVDVRVVRADRCGEGGFDIWAPAAGAADVWAALLAAPGIRAAGRRALDVRRIEAGIPWPGAEITSESFPIEAGLDDGWISYTKGCYLGQETISRLRHLGHVNRHLRGLILQVEVEPGAVVLAGDRRVGRVTSAARSPRLDRPVALAYVHRDAAEPGTTVAVATAGGRIPARVAALPMA